MSLTEAAPALRPLAVPRRRRTPSWAWASILVAALMAGAAAGRAGRRRRCRRGAVVARIIARTTLPEMLGNSVLLALLVGADGGQRAGALSRLAGHRLPLPRPRRAGGRAAAAAWRCRPMSAATPIPGCWTWRGRCRPALRAATGLRWGQYWFPEIRSLPGAALMLAMVLYPYVYLLCRGAFQQQSVCLLEASPHPRPFAAALLPPPRPADGPAGDRRRRRAGADGDAGGFRHGAAFRRPHLHHRHLRGLVRPGRPRRRQPARRLPDGAGRHAAGCWSSISRGGRRFHPTTTAQPAAAAGARCVAGRRRWRFAACAHAGAARLPACRPGPCWR